MAGKQLLIELYAPPESADSRRVIYPMGNDSSLNFHATFRLQRSRLAEVLGLAAECGPLVAQDLEGTSLGVRMWPAFLEWGRLSGVLTKSPDGYSLSVLGSAVQANDPSLTRIDTQWLLHYELTVASGNGPAFWQQVVSDLFFSAMPFTRNTLVPSILGAIPPGKSPNSAATTAGVLLNTYVEVDGLGQLGLLTRLSVGAYQAEDPSDRISAHGFFYALIDLWEDTQPALDTMNISAMHAAGSVAETLFLSPDEIDRYLNVLKRAGQIDVFRTAPPYQVVRFWDNHQEAKAYALQGMYGGHDLE